ncbi:DUF2141 domain-containing protein [Pseudomonadota bacterium]
MNHRLQTGLLLLMVALSAAAGNEIKLRVTVEGLVPHEGQAIVSLFNEEDQFLGTPMKMIREPVADSDRLSVEFEGLRAGVYAVSVIYDVDGDGELDTGMFRIPKEPIGVSNNVRSKFGPPKWKKANFDLEDDMHLTIQVLDAIN